MQSDIHEATRAQYHESFLTAVEALFCLECVGRDGQLRRRTHSVMDGENVLHPNFGEAGRLIVEAFLMLSSLPLPIFRRPFLIAGRRWLMVPNSARTVLDDRVEIWLREVTPT